MGPGFGTTKEMPNYAQRRVRVPVGDHTPLARVRERDRLGKDRMK